MQKGSITIYLALTMAIMLSLLLTVIDGARRNAIRVEADCAFDLAVYSVFAEYNAALFDQYHLLFVDTSYGKTDGSVDQVREHLIRFTKMNLSEGAKTVKQADFTKTFLEDASIDGISYATDEEAKIFERQAIYYMKQKYGLSYVERLKEEMTKAEKLQLFTRNVDRERNANQAIIDEAKEKGKETGKTDEQGNPITEKIELDNPADAVNGTRASGVLLLVTDAGTVISGKEVKLADCYSRCGASNKGQGLAGRNDISVGEKALFHAYIKDVCGCYTKQKDKGALSYQLEYILAGKERDDENLKNVVQRLLVMREVSNVTYLFSDGAKQAEAATLATSVCSAAGVPYLIEPVKISLLFAWAYAESLYDVRQLLKGKRIQLVKGAQDWHISLSGMLNCAKEEAADAVMEEQEDNLRNGLSYEDYLLLMIMTKSEKEKVARMIDLIELDIRQTPGNYGFRMQNCVDAMSMQASVGSSFGYSCEVERVFCYQ